MGFLQQLFGAGENENLKQAIADGAFLVDVRTPEEFAGGHVKGSVNIPLHAISANLSAFKNKKNIVVFCLSGGRSSQAKTILEQNGFTQVINGGTWKQVNRYVH